MNLIKININTKKLFRSKKSRSISRSEDPSSFSSGTSSDSFESSSKTRGVLKSKGLSTPVSVLPSHLSGDEWSKVPTEVCLELVQAFKLIDRDGDGKITTDELEKFLIRVGAEPPSQEEMRMLVSDLDGDGDGCIILEDLGPISSAFAPPSSGDELKVVFEFFDADHDGRITAEELFDALSSFGDGRCTLEDCQQMISGVDKNGDRFVCFEDFSRMMEQQS